MALHMEEIGGALERNGRKNVGGEDMLAKDKEIFYYCPLLLLLLMQIVYSYWQCDT